MKPLFAALPGNEAIAGRLAEAAHADICACEFRAFPDGESYIRVNGSPKDRTVVLVSSLAHPNEKFLPLIFAANTLRELGARRIGLVAPYLAYMRQDCRFRSGEAVTSRIFAGLLSRGFDWLVTVDPHLHRYKSLDEIYSIPCRALHAGPAIAEWIKRNVDSPFIIGPDGESRQWVAAVAAACGAGYDVFQKSRLGDRSVAISAPSLQIPPDATPVLLDDIVSSGATVLQAMAIVRRHTPSPALAIAIHMLGDESLGAALDRIGARLITTNTIPTSHAEIDVAPLLAKDLAALVP
jgi:ribose-phosphate pyrophosphokinase